MKIEAVDFFYLSMPEVTTEGDGSQDALLVRVAAGVTGWGECEASPLVSIAAFVCPMSHGACRPVSMSVLGQHIDGAEDIERIAAQIELDSMDLLQAPHTWSGIEIALWDLLGKVRQEPVWKLLGYNQSYPKLPYASQLFGDSPAQTYQLASEARAQNFRAVKFGWGPIGRGDLQTDNDHFHAAREGLGKDALLMVDVGQIFAETWMQRPTVCLCCSRLGRCGSKNLFTPAHSTPMRLSRIKAQSSSPEAREPTMCIWPGTSSITERSASFRSIRDESVGLARPNARPTMLYQKV